MQRRLSFFLLFSFLGLWFISALVGFSYAGALVYSTYWGGGDYDRGNGIAVNSSGNVYITGETYSSDFPTTSGAFDTSYNGSGDVFVSKLNTSGTAVLYSTILGGTGLEQGYSIAVDKSGNAYITGYTNSADFPTTSDAFDTSFNGYYDGFVSKLNASGTALVYSTYLGGEDYDYGNSIVIDGSGNAYITGYTSSSVGFPTTPGAFDTSYNGYDAFVSKLNTSGTALVYSTFLGGEDYDSGNGIAIDGSGNTYITGQTSSADFPTTSAAFDTSYNGGFGYIGSGDVFVTKLNPNGFALVYSTYLGGEDWDEGKGITLDGSGNAYITGQTYSSYFPVTLGSFDTSFYYNTEHGFIVPDVFVSKLNASGTALVYSTYLGGASSDYGYGIVVDSLGNAYIAGYTTSTTFPTTPGAFDTSYNGYDTFVSKLNSSGTALLYSTFLGGGMDDDGQGIAYDNSWNVYIVGLTESVDFPTTSNALDTSSNGGYDVFVTKISFFPYLNSYGDFTGSSNTTRWYFEKYGDGTAAGTLSWTSTFTGKSGIAKIRQQPGQKGKLTQVFSVPSTGWYTAMANVATDIATIAKQQKVYLYLQEFDSSTAVVATGNVVVQPGAGRFSSTSSWRKLEISFYCQNTLLGVQVVVINPTTSGATGSLYIDYIWVIAGAAQPNSSLTLNNGSFSSGTTGWGIQIYGDGTGTGTWSGISSWFGHTGVLSGTQNAGEKAKVSQLCSLPSQNPCIASVWVASGAGSINNTQKIYLYVYSYDSGYTKIIESGNAVLQPGKWTPGQWQKLQFGYTPFTKYNTVQLVGINPTGRPYQGIYFDAVDLKK